MAVGEEDAAAWVNAVLAEAAADGGTVDSRIASVSLKLQTMSADLHADVDADMRALLAAAPRAVGEIEDLQAALQRVQDELAAVDARVARAVHNATEAARRSEITTPRTNFTQYYYPLSASGGQRRSARWPPRRRPRRRRRQCRFS